MNDKKAKYIPVDKTGSGLLLLTDAAKYLRMSRNTLNRQCKDQVIPPPILTEPRRYWSEHQLELYKRGMIKRNKHGIWYEWQVDDERWRRAPNQYVSTLPQEAA